VLGRQLDAETPERLVPVDGERSPLLGAELQGGQDGFPAMVVTDIDDRTAVGERRTAALASKRGAGRAKDLTQMPALEATLAAKKAKTPSCDADEASVWIACRD